MSGQRLVNAAKVTHRDLAEVVLDLEQIQQRLAGLRRDLGYAVSSYDSGAVTELPDNDHHDPRD